jgi:hypothetical protein
MKSSEEYAARLRYEQAMGGKIERPNILKGRTGIEYPHEDINPEDVPF